MPVSGLSVDRHVLECKQGSFLSFLITRFNGKSASTLAILRRMELPLRKKRLNPCPCCGYLYVRVHIAGELGDLPGVLLGGRSDSVR